MSTAPATVRIVTHAGPFAVAEPSAGAEACPDCGGEGRRVIEREGVPVVQPCGCQDARGACRLFNAARLPRLLGTRTLEVRRPGEADPDTYEPQTEGQARAHRAVRRFVDSYPKERGSGRGFLLMGRPGTGKSHLLVGALRELTLTHHVPARYVEFFHLLSELKEGYTQGKSELDIIAPLCEVEVLAVDELGKGRGSEWELYVMDEIISRRYNYGRTTIFATNYTTDRQSTLKDKAGKKGGFVRTGGPGFVDEMTAETLEERVGVRIFSRLHEMCALIPMGADAPDYRRTRAAAPGP